MKLEYEGGTSIVKLYEDKAVKEYKNEIIELSQPLHSHHRGEDMFEREIDFLYHMRKNKIKGTMEIIRHDKKNRKIEMRLYNGSLEHGMFTTREKKQIMYNVAETLDILHDQGICHNDLGMSNILYTRSSDGQIKSVITDFGDAVYVVNTRNNRMNRYSKEATMRDYKRYYETYRKLTGEKLDETYDWKDAIEELKDQI